jgi:hypothetical protein
MLASEVGEARALATSALGPNIGLQQNMYVGQFLAAPQSNFVTQSCCWEARDQSMDVIAYIIDPRSFMATGARFLRPVGAGSWRGSPSVDLVDLLNPCRPLSRSVRI